MPRIHGGTPATAVRSGSRPAPPDSRYLADQKGSGRPLRYRIQAMGITQSQVTKNTRPAALCVGAAWVRRPVARFHHSRFEYNGRLLRATNHEPRATIFSRAEGYSRRCRHSEAVAAQRHLSPRRPANCDRRSAGRQAPKFDER